MSQNQESYHKPYNKDLHVLNRYKVAHGFKTDVELADYLGVSRNTIPMWRQRKSFNVDLLLQKREESVQIEWLLFGKGDMHDWKKISSDARWKRLLLLRYSTTRFHGVPHRVAEAINVSPEQYLAWEQNQEPVPDEVMERIFELVKDHISSEWWYEGKNTEFAPYKDDPLKLIGKSEPDPNVFRSPGIPFEIEDQDSPRPFSDTEEIQGLIDAIWRESGSTRIRGYVYLLVSILQKLGVQIKEPKEEKR